MSRKNVAPEPLTAADLIRRLSQLPADTVIAYESYDDEGTFLRGITGVGNDGLIAAGGSTYDRYDYRSDEDYDRFKEDDDRHLEAWELELVAADQDADA